MTLWGEVFDHRECNAINTILKISKGWRSEPYLCDLKGIKHVTLIINDAGHLSLRVLNVELCKPLGNIGTILAIAITVMSYGRVFFAKSGDTVLT